MSSHPYEIVNKVPVQAQAYERIRGHEIYRSPDYQDDGYGWAVYIPRARGTDMFGTYTLDWMRYLFTSRSEAREFCVSMSRAAEQPE